MKVSFWKNCYGILFFWPFMTILSFSSLVVGIVLTINQVGFWPIILVCSLVLFLCIYAIFFHKSTLSKIIFSNEGIELKHLGKIIKSINWF